MKPLTEKQYLANYYKWVLHKSNKEIGDLLDIESSTAASYTCGTLKNLFFSQISDKVPIRTLNECTNYFCGYLFQTSKNTIKCGYSKNIKQRYYGTSALRVVQIFPFNDQEDAYIMEVVLHRYLKSIGCKQRTQDYFIIDDWSKIDFMKLEKLYANVNNFSKEY